jgi:modulator of FtsH protease
VGEWHEFFLAQAGAAGVLVGLVFVGVSINLEKILSDPASGLTGRAAEALILLVAVLTASTLLLVPGQGTTLIGAEVLAVGLAAWGWVSAIQSLRLRVWRTMRPDLRRAFVLRAALGQAATLPLVAAGVAVLTGGLGGLYWLAAGMVVSILVALFGAWVLLVEINR